MFVGGIPHKDACENIGATFLPVGSGNTQMLLDLIKKVKANVLHATPSYILYFIKQCQQKGENLKKLSINKIFAGSEPGLSIKQIRNKIEDEFDALAFEAMGNSDISPVFFSECQYQEGMHFLGQGLIYCELIDPKTGETIDIEDGSTGELQCTTLKREASPVIRLRLGDIVTCMTGKCDCGRTGFRIKIKGRIDDMLKVKGLTVWPNAIRETIYSFIPQVSEYLQIIVPNSNRLFSFDSLNIVVEYVGSKNSTELSNLKTLLRNEIKTKIGINSNIILVPEGIIQHTEKKFPWIKKDN